MCYSWNLGTGIVNPGQTVEITVGLAPGVVGPQNLPIILSAGREGDGSVPVPAGATVSAIFVPALQEEGHVYWGQCETCGEAAGSVDSIVAPKCLDGGDEGDGGSDLDDKSGPKDGTDDGDSSEDENPYDFTMGLGYLPDGSPAGMVTYSPSDLTANFVQASALVVHLADSGVTSTLGQDNVGTIDTPSVHVAIANIASGATGFTITCTKPGAGVPFVTWRFTQSATLPFPRLLVEKIVAGVVVSSEQVTKLSNGWDLEKGPTYVSGVWARKIEYRRAPVGADTNFTRKESSRFNLSSGTPVLENKLVADVAWTLVNDKMSARRVGDVTTTYTYDGTGTLASIVRSDGGWQKFGGITYDMQSWKMVQRPTGDLTVAQAVPDPVNANSGSVVLTRSNPVTRVDYRKVFEDGHLVSTAITARGLPNEYSATTLDASGNSLPVTVNETTTTYFDGKVTISKVCNYPAAAVEPYRGRLFYSYSTRNSQTTYRNSTYEPAILNGVNVWKETTYEKEQAFANGQFGGPVVFIPNRSKVYVRFVDTATRKVLREEERLIVDVENWSDVLLSATENTYDADGHLLSTSRNGNEVYSAEWTNGNMTAEVDEHGSRTEYSSFDSDGRALTVTKTGFAGNGVNAPSQSSSVSVTAYDILGRKASETLIGFPTIVRTWDYDTTGRIISRADSVVGFGVTGTSGTFSYGLTAQGGRQTSSLTSSGISQVTDYFRDGSQKALSGNGVVAETRSFVWDDGAGLGMLKKMTITRGVGAEAVVQHRYTDLAGRVRLTQEPSPWTDDGWITRQFNYAPSGEVSAELTEAFATMTRTQQSLYSATGTRLVTSQPWVAVQTFEQAGIEVVDGQRYAYQRTERGGSRSQLTGLDGVVAGKGVLTAHSQQLAEGGTVAGESFTYVDRANKLVRTETFRAGATSPHIRVVRNGRLESEQAPGYSSPKVVAYDALGRQASVKDPATGKTTEYAYLSPAFAFKPSYVAEKDAAGTVVNTTFNQYNTRGTLAVSSPTSDITANGTWYSYNDRGQLEWQRGVRSYPIRYTYNSVGLLRTMTTYHGPKADGNWLTPNDFTLITAPDSAGAPSVTEWNYYPGTTKLSSKKDADNKSVAYEYDAFGRLNKRTWARTVDGAVLSADFHYDFLGQLVSINYSDATPDVTWSVPDARGRYTTIADGAGTRTLVRTAQPGGGEQLVETLTPANADGFATMTMTSVRDVTGRVTDIDATADAIGLMDQTFSYDGADGRLRGTGEVLTGVAAMYGRATNSEFVNETVTYSGTLAGALAGAATERQRFTRSRDGEGRLAGVQTTRPGAITLEARTFGYDSLDRRTSDTRQDGSMWDYGYNSRNEVTSASRKNAAGTALNGWLFDYAFDAIGNRYYSSGQPYRTYTTNVLNQYSASTAMGTADIVGEVTTPNTIVWARRLAPPPTEPIVQSTETARQGAWFYRRLDVDNTAGPVDAEVAVTGIRTGETNPILTETGRILVPKAAETFTYDSDGNTTGDSLWTYTWDAENRLVEVVSKLPASSSSYRKVKFTHDYASRIVKKEVWKWNGTAWASEYRRYFVWQGWNIIAELEHRSTAGAYTGTATLLRRNVWGLDLSGSLQGAGGVGGLLAVQNLPSATVTTPVYDGNGNILAYHDLTTGAKVAEYAYGPFGEPLRISGTMAKNHPFRFSTKYTDEETGLVLYQLRAYRADLGRWLSKDPIGERGGLNLYGMVGNSPLQLADYLGLKKLSFLEGVESMAQITDKLRDIANDDTCSCGDKHEKIEKIGELLTDRLQELWRINHDSTEGDGAAVGGHLCWDWAKGYKTVADAIYNNAGGKEAGMCKPKYEEFKEKEAMQLTLRPPTDGNIHFSTKICFGNCDNDKCCISIDDGYFGGSSCVHDSSAWPYLGNDWEEVLNPPGLNHAGGPFFPVIPPGLP